ncbi:MAG: serine hydrolase [Marinicaulis sp.]|nr:serine hydrolase [Marinicaulis sp.]
MLHEPGTAYAYSSSAYNIIAAVLERVHGKNFSEVRGQLILEPLSLKSTAVGNVMRPTLNLARSYSYVDIWSYQPSAVLQQVPT